MQHEDMGQIAPQLEDRIWFAAVILLSPIGYLGSTLKYTHSIFLKENILPASKLPKYPFISAAA